MKLILIFLINFISFILSAQDGYIFTKEQHEQIKKNLNDYKILIKEYDFQSIEFEKTKKEFELLKSLHNNETIEFLKLKKEYNELKYRNIELSETLSENEELKRKIITLNDQIDHKNNSIFILKNKYYRELKFSKGERIISNAIWATFVSCAILAIYIEVEERYLHN